MTDLTDILGQLVGQVVENPLVVLAFHLAAVYLVVVWLAVAWWTFHDLRRRTHDPIAPWLATAGILLVTPLAFPLALVLYHIARPAETFADRAAGDLEQALLAAEAQRARCPACEAPVDEAWVRCPTCGTVLAVSCPRCGRNAGLDWLICAWCASELPWAAVGIERGAGDLAASGPGIRPDDRAAGEWASAAIAELARSVVRRVRRAAQDRGWASEGRPRGERGERVVRGERS